MKNCLFRLLIKRETLTSRKVLYTKLNVRVISSFFASCIKSKVLKILTCIRQENTNEQYCDTIKDLLLPNTITGQKDEKPHTAGLDDTKILLQKSSIPQYHEPPCPPQ